MSPTSSSFSSELCLQVPSSLPEGHGTPLPQELQGKPWKALEFYSGVKESLGLSMCEGAAVGTLPLLPSNADLQHGEVLFLNSRSVVLFPTACGLCTVKV